VGAREVAVGAALVGGTAWMAKLAVMAAQGGPQGDSVPEAIAFFTGLLGLVVAAAAAGLHRTRHRSSGARAASALLAVVLLVVVAGSTQSLLTALPGDSWVQAEAVFGLVGAAAVIAALTASRSRRPH
jgi:hypothetical protein